MKLIKNITSVLSAFILVLSLNTNAKASSVNTLADTTKMAKSKMKMDKMKKEKMDKMKMDKMKPASKMKMKKDSTSKM